MRIFNYNLHKALVPLVLIATIPIASAQPYAYVSNLSGNSVSVVNTANNTIAATIGVAASPSGLAVTPDGGSVYVANRGANAVSVISTASNSVITTISVGASPIQLAITPNGAQVYVVDQGSNQVTVIDTASKTAIATINVGSKPNAVAISPDGTRAYVTNLYGGNVSMIDTNSKSVIGSFPTASGPSGITTTPNGRVYVGNQYSNSVTVHDASGNLLGTIGGFAFPTWVSSTPNGSRVFVTNGNSGSISIIDTSSNGIIATVPVGSNPTSVAVSADGVSAYVTNEYSFSLSQVSVAGSFVTNTLQHVGEYPFAVAMQPPASGTPPPSCTYSLSASSASFGAVGGTGSVNVFAPAGCSWGAASNVGWAQITGGGSGSGNGTVSYSVSPNVGTSGLSGTLTIAGLPFTISQTGAAFAGIRVHCGGGQLIDGGGNVWSPDSAQNFNVTNAAIGNTAMPALYQTEAWSTGTLQ